MTVVLCLNCGSSSVKAALVSGDPTDPVTGLAQLARLEVAGIGTATARLRVGDDPPTEVAVGDHDAATALVLSTLDRLDHPAPAAVGHRLVHGGADLIDPVVLDDGVVERLRALVPFAPLHLPAELAAVGAVVANRPDLPQVGCFDTAFHASLPPVSWRLPLPAWTVAAGVRRYGFHGLSYEWAVASLGADALGRSVIAHLGNGASATAVVDGRSVDTTMGLTPTGGLVMGTRSGDLDPGVLVHLQRHEALDAEAVAALVDHEAGLLALSGTTSDMRELLARSADGDDRAELAIDVFCHSAAKHVAALTTSAGGLDSLVFTGGIGERSPEIRSRIAGRLAHLGVVIDPSANQRGDGPVSPPGSPVAVWAHRTDEEAVVARHVLDVLHT